MRATSSLIYPLIPTCRCASSARSGRVLLAGDAAHVFGAGGSALNVGLSDAIALAEKLVLALPADDDAARSHLDAYAIERHAAARRTIALTRVQQALEASDPTGDALRDLFGVLLSDGATIRRIARLIEG